MKPWPPSITTPTPNSLTPLPSSKTVSSFPTSPPFPKSLCGGSSGHRVSVLTVLLSLMSVEFDRVQSFRAQRGISLLFGAPIGSVHGTIYRNSRNAGDSGGGLRIFHRPQSYQTENRPVGIGPATPAWIFRPAFCDRHQTLRLPRQWRQQTAQLFLRRFRIR